MVVRVGEIGAAHVEEGAQPHVLGDPGERRSAHLGGGRGDERRRTVPIGVVAVHEDRVVEHGERQRGLPADGVGMDRRG